MHNGPAHPKKRGHGKKAKALAKQAAAANKAAATSSETSPIVNNTTTSTSTSVNTPTTSVYHQTMQNLQQSTFARPTLLGLYAASTETLNNLNVGRNYEPNNIQH